MFGIEHIKDLTSKAFSVGIHPSSDEAIEDQVDAGLEAVNNQKAQSIAVLVRDKGTYKYGPMWAEITWTLKDGRGVWIQCSATELVVAIRSTDHTDLNVNIRHDYRKGALRSFEESNADANRIERQYNVLPWDKRLPETLSRLQASQKFNALLDPLELAARQAIRFMYDDRALVRALWP